MPLTHYPRTRYSCILIALFFIAGLVALSPFAAAEAKMERLEIMAVSGPVAFMVEIAKTPEQKARGLMYRREMPANHGMLFDFGREQLIMMWMKNTFLSLDMIFISADGRIKKIARNTKPLSLEVIESGARVRAVLELLGGTAKRLGLKPGDIVRHPIFRPPATGKNE